MPGPHCPHADPGRVGRAGLSAGRDAAFGRWGVGACGNPRAEDARAKQLGPVEVCCEAPPYPVVRACRAAGIRSPEDVRWLRRSTFRGRRPGRTRGLRAILWGLFRGPVGRACTCGGRLPALAVLAAPIAADAPAYVLGQCARCRTVFWDEA